MSNRLDEIEAREKAATPGPWRGVVVGRRFDLVAGNVERVCLYEVATSLDATTPCAHMTEADASFSAHARDDVPWLVAQVRERDAEIARLRAILSDAVTALGHGGVASPECSLEFLALIPGEVRGVVKALRAERDDAVREAVESTRATLLGPGRSPDA